MDAAEAYADVYQKAVDFYTGDYFEKEMDEGPKIYKEMAKADTQYKNAAKKAFATKLVWREAQVVARSGRWA